MKQKEFFFQSFVEAFEIGSWQSLFVETDFLVEILFSHFSDTPYGESYFLSSGNTFLN